jgi:ATP-dependent DNA ligase
MRKRKRIVPLGRDRDGNCCNGLGTVKKSVIAQLPRQLWQFASEINGTASGLQASKIEQLAACRQRPVLMQTCESVATLVDEPFDDKAWVFETKWDGFRLITEKRGDTVRLWSRNGIDATTRYEVLLPALQKIQGSCVIDGELCALDAHERSRFQLLQNALNRKARLLYVIFDALFVDGKDIRETPLLERKETLKAILPRSAAALQRARRRVRQAGICQGAASAREGRNRQARRGVLLLG